MGRLLLHRDNNRPKAQPRNPERDVIEMRKFWYDQPRGSHESKLAVLWRRFSPHGWTGQQIEDVVYYRSFLSVQDVDVTYSCREANY